MVMTLATPPSLPAAAPGCCPGCGYALPADLDDSHGQLLQAQAKIHDLETQVRLLNEKATAAVDRWADYEDELTKLRAQLPQNQSRRQPPQEEDDRPPPPPPKSPAATNSRMSFLQSGTSRLSALLTPRKSTPELRTLDTRTHQHHQHPHPAQRNASSPVPPPSPSNEDLLEALSREQNLRKEAEGQVAATSKEIEELSAALFEQANEMVAEERRARAKLEERVGELERRDAEKRRRLEKLEGAMQRIERVRLLLAESDDSDEDALDEEEEDVEFRGYEELERLKNRQHGNTTMKPGEPVTL
ncbi:hypothetical protein B0T10DRAFT_457931 [Thelonectria olida]|uniref:GDP/GTP exchange factor Sec2 N-terminal domain-containing protein n=1 Tax=Thelonectria olida TaxID=1576542 RepID=A0A9P9ARH6_9HYPO|nr:hypothetical protein B0T10DRAFT_457931 [Thelonectria olida]